MNVYKLIDSDVLKTMHSELFYVHILTNIAHILARFLAYGIVRVV